MRSTKFLAATALVAISTPVFAQDMASDSARIISDPLYLPLQGQIYGSTGYTYGSGVRDTYDLTGTRIDTTNTISNVITQEFQYGITDDFTLRFNWDYDVANVASRNPVGGAEVRRDSSGWTDPEFGVVYRLMDQRDSPLTLDLHADYAPDAFPAKAANVDDSGTVARGGQMADFGATLGHEGPMFTAAAVFNATWFGPRDVLNQLSGDTSRTDSMWNYRLGLATQTRLNDQFSINAGVGHTFTNNGTVFNETTGLGHFTTGGDVTDVNAALNYTFVPNTVVASLEYQHNFYQNSRNLFPTSPTSDTEVRNHDEDFVGVTARYVFP